MTISIKIPRRLPTIVILLIILQFLTYIVLKSSIFLTPNQVLILEQKKIAKELQTVSNSLIYQKVLIVSSWRSGSSFIGEILSSFPASFYHFEPLMPYSRGKIRGAPKDKLGHDVIKKLFNCDYSEMREYLQYAKQTGLLLQRNKRLWNWTSDVGDAVYDEEFLTDFCRLFPLHVMKIVLMRLDVAAKLLNDTSLNVKIILLVRDPRGIYQSRQHHPNWCLSNPNCADIKALCDDLVDDYEASRILTKIYPKTFKVIKYEDLSTSPYIVTRDVFHFLGLPFHQNVIEFLDTHTKVNDTNHFSTFRDSKAAALHWMNDLNQSKIVEIQDICGDALQVWEYKNVY